MTAPRILGFGGRYSYGDQTLFHDIVRAIGAVNVGAEHGLHGYDMISTEQILRWDPEWIVSGAAKGKSPETLQRLMEDPAVRLTTAAGKGQILVFENHVFLPVRLALPDGPNDRSVCDSIFQGDQKYVCKVRSIQECMFNVCHCAGSDRDAGVCTCGEPDGTGG